MTQLTRHGAAVLLAAASVAAGTAWAKSPAPVPTKAPAAQVPLRDFFAKPERTAFGLSEDGATLSFMQPVADATGKRRMNIFVQTLKGSEPQGTPRALTSETARDIAGYDWKGSETLLYVKDFGGDENFHVVAVDVASGQVRDLTPGDKLRAEMMDALPEDPAHILVSHNGRDPEVMDVYRVDVRTGEQVLVARNPGDIVGWQSDHAGRVRIALRSDGLNFVMLYRDNDAGEFKPLITYDYKVEVDPQFFAADDRRFYALSNRGRDKKALVLIDPARPDEETMVFVHPEVDLEHAHWSRKRHLLTSVDYQTAKPDHEFFDAAIKAMYRDLRTRLPGMSLTLTSNNKDETRFIVAAANDRTPGARYLYDTAARSLTKLADINPKISEAAMAPLKPVSYKSRDGLTIHGYLTLPPGKPARNLACIVNPHGGPWARDSWRYKAEVQFLANRGYCVLQMNFRGSTGYGRQFLEASFKQWGLAMQDDITDGAQWLVAQGIADPKRLAIYGGSYGGYATLVGITKTPDLYAAAVDYCGVSNLFSFMKTIPPYWQPMLPKFHAMIGDPEADKERLALTSPALHADKIKTPLLVAQGARDPRVKKAESDQIVEALQKRGVQVQYLVKDNEGHGFRNEENQFEFYAEMEKFLAGHLKP